jgi:putative DNA primase/helicase
MAVSKPAREPAHLRLVKPAGPAVADVRKFKQAMLDYHGTRIPGMKPAQVVARCHRELLCPAESSALGGPLAWSFRISYFNAKGKKTEFFRLRYLEDTRKGIAKVTTAKPIRYWQSAGSGCHLYLSLLLPGGWAKRQHDASVPWIITEGELKADAACVLGLLAIGIGGVENWRGDAFEELERLLPPGCKVVIVFDSDVATKPEVARAERQLAAMLIRIGISVYAKHLPSDAKGDKQGLDDFLMKHGRPAFDELPEVSIETVESLTDLGNARRFARLHGADVRYSPNLGGLVWNGNRWIIDKSGEVARLAKNTVTSIYTEATREKDDTRRQRLARWAVASENTHRLNAMVEVAQTEPGMYIAIDELDADPWVLGVENGVLDLRTGKLRPARREDLITKRAPVVYDPKATCQEWLAFLNRILAKNKQLIAYMQRLIGYSLTGETSEQMMPLLWGGGENGKTTMINALSEMLGDYAATTPATTLMVRRGGEIPNDLARLRGARFVTAIETEAGHRLAESLVKQLTGGDTIAARFLHREFFEFKPQFKIWLAANHKPVIRGDDHAIWRRIHLIPFEVRITKEERDTRLGEKLRAELPGILAWAVRGCLAWQRDGLNPPAIVTSATDAYRLESDALRTWIDECCVTGKNIQGQASKLYDSYKEWARSNEEHVVSQRHFAQRLEERGFRRKQTRTGNVYLGVDVQHWPEDKKKWMS